MPALVRLPPPASDLDKLTIRTFPGFNEDPYDFLLQNREWAFCSVADKLRYLKTHPAISPETKVQLCACPPQGV